MRDRLPLWLIPLAILVVVGPSRAHAQTEAAVAVGDEAAKKDAYVERLIEALKDDDSFKVRLQAAVFLGRSEDGRCVEPLIKALTNDPHYTVRAAAATALANLNEVTAIPHIVRAEATDVDEFVREEAGRALRKFDREDALRYVWAAFGSEDQRVRREVVRYLSEGPFDDGEGVYMRALGDTPEIFGMAREAVSSVEGEGRLRFLESAIEHPDPGVRRGAVGVLHELGSKPATDLILKVYERDIEVDQVRNATRDALRSLRGNLDMPGIIKAALGDPDKHARARSLKLLGVVGGPDAKSALLKALADSEIYLRGTAVMALRELGSPDAIVALEKLLQDSSNQRIALQIRTAVKHLRQQEPPRAN